MLLDFEAEGPTRHTRAFRWLPEHARRVLDYGCGDGRFIASVASVREQLECYGCDVDTQAIERAERSHSGVRFGRLTADGVSPFEAGYFDAVCMLDVLEHVPDERLTLQEVARVMRPQGTLLLSVPHAGPFTWLDTGNIKFRFPRLHRAFYRYVLRDMDRYHRRFGNVGDGLYGDVSVSERMWHRHYSRAELFALLEPDFEIAQATCFSLVPPVWSGLVLLYTKVTKRGVRLLDKVMGWDLSLEMGRLSYNVIVKATRK